MAYCLARTFATGPAQRIAIAVERGLQNGTLVLAVFLFGGGLATVPAATCSPIMLATVLTCIARGGAGVMRDEITQERILRF